jgi:uroporphyrinogen-III synthase
MVGSAQTPFVVLTRPEGKNELLAARLQAHGVVTLTLPALSIRPVAAQRGDVPLPGDYDLLVFVSGNAVRFYLELLARENSGAPWPASTLVATVGEASARPLYTGGVVPHQNILHPDLLESQQDSEGLWRLLETRVHTLRRVLIVRGNTGREWLGQRLEQAGVAVQRYAVYQREPALWSAQQLQRLQEGLMSAQPVIWLFTSAESAEALVLNARKYNIDIFGRNAVFVAIHDRVASRLQLLSGAGAGKAQCPVVKICSPSDDAIFDTVVSAAFPL